MTRSPPAWPGPWPGQGGNITGIYTMTEEMNPKRLDLLKEVVPSIRRVGVLLREDFPNVGRCGT